MKPTLILVCLLLCGCAGSPLRYAVDRDGEEKRMAAEHDQRCQSYGAQPGTQPYISCRTQLANAASAERTARVISAADSIANAYRPPTYINCTTFGNMTTCH